ncbi:hypothetical protein CICLE_v10033650mg [Citrus x clementina]|uniref:hAT-like transposase RNase-H fold domain-containing protein n=1 Tax=Citrus clementina TaxID=85681 RepID=V4TE40_CITCL|nr:hypothetical protein CICLE_v10033650mg [Citrus x clementina]
MIDWEIESLFMITIDNVSANEKTVNYLKKKLGNWSWDSLVLNGLYLHVRCSAHKINLIVNDSLDVVKISIDNIRNTVKYVRSSLLRLQKFKACVNAEKISYNGFMVLDVLTRWNSKFLMLTSMNSVKNCMFIKG